MPDYKYVSEHSLSVKTTCYSNFPVDKRPKTVILNSRQSKIPCGDDSWIAGSLEAVNYACSNDQILITSTGMNTWELICWAAGGYSGYQIIALPLPKNGDIKRIVADIEANFGLNEDNTGWLFFDSMPKAKSVKSNWQLRDRIVIEFADIIIPISIRQGGNLSGLIKSQVENGTKALDSRFQVAYAGHKMKHPKMPETASANFQHLPWDYITHWTRTFHGHFPGQTSGDFYDRLVKSKDSYPNNALSALKNILLEKKIRSSSTNLRQGISAVAFSSLRPGEVVSLMRWRKRYVRWNFEPFGIAISRQAALARGIQPVIYGDPALYDRLSDKDKPYFQSHGIAGGNWREEKEWRHIGDLDFASIHHSDIKIIVGKPEDIERVACLTESEVISFA
jgi:hypothetical protein